MNEKKRVALAVTCLVDQLMPEVGVAAVRLLKRAGYAVDFPAEQSCCGQPFFNSGFREEAAHLAKRAIEIFEPYDAVVLPAGSCASMIRVEYPHLLSRWAGWHQRALELAQKTYELSEFLVHVARWKPAAVADAPAITYHDSCHMCRLLRLREEPRALLAAVGCEIEEMHEPDRCCGFGGLFSLRMAEVSNAITSEKVRQAGATGAPTLVTADPGCLMQIRGQLSDSSPQAAHIACLLEELTR